MVKAEDNFALGSAGAVRNSLRIQRITFRGPFYTPGKKHVVFLVESYLLLESELVELFVEKKLNRDGIQALAKRIETTKSRSHPRPR